MPFKRKKRVSIKRDVQVNTTDKTGATKKRKQDSKEIQKETKHDVKKQKLSKAACIEGKSKGSKSPGKRGRKVSSEHVQHDHDHHGHDHHDDDDQGHHDDHDHKMDAKKWSSYYDSQSAADDHEDVVHECLVKYKHLLITGSSKPLKIFVPLCGQVYDMTYLANLGHEVVGVEYALSAAVNFFRNSQLPLRIDDVPGTKGNVLRSVDKKQDVTIYNCDLYDFQNPLPTGFDAIWDSGAMHSLPKSELKKYVLKVKSLLKKGCPWLVEFTYPSCSGHVVTSHDLLRLLGKGFSVEDLGKTETKRQFFLKFGIQGFEVFLIKKQ